MKPIAVTMGDPAGIGPEICVKMFSEGLPCAALVIGDANILCRTATVLGLPVQIREITHPSEALAINGVLNVLSISSLPADLRIGEISATAGRAAFEYVDTATDLALAGEVSAIVTAPISKESLKAAGISYPGHTEILAAKSGSEDFAMMLANDHLRSMLVTIHVSLADAARLITRQRVLRTIRLAHQACLDCGIKDPKIGVAGLNPHAGEGGMFGSEEQREIIPAIADAKAEGIAASGPWPGDTIFMRARRGDFDIVVAQYHDQGLIPVKLDGIEQGVNVTVGLPFVRTSVDHGTAFDIAGTGKADAASLRYAFDHALKLAKHRPTAFEEMRPSRFIFMLTHDDRTIPDACERLQDVLTAGIRHIGFKDIGLPFAELKRLADAIKAGNATCYLEVVSLDEASERRSAQAAVDLGVDILMGGTRPEVVLPVIKGKGIQYFPFPGHISGHPSVLNGPAEAIIDSARSLAALDGVTGLDLLAYRFDGDVPQLIRDVTVAVAPKPVVVAGSIDRKDRVDAVRRAGAFGFTVGTAALNGAIKEALSPELRDQLAAICAMAGDGHEEQTAPQTKVNLASAFGTFTEKWSPRVAGNINNLQITLAKFAGAFHWHFHENDDELLLVTEGRLRMNFRDRSEDLGPGEFIIVPRMVEHLPEALTAECNVVLLEPNLMLNAGDIESDHTVHEPAMV